MKFFGPDGGKLGDALEAEIESWLDRPLECVEPARLGRAKRVDDASGRYIEACKSTFDGTTLKGLKLVVDCANGAAYRVAPAVFEELGAEVIAIGAQPNGLNINDNCGSTHLAPLQAAVLHHGAHLGIALDGDADRCLMVDEQGAVVDGDQILYIVARMRAQAGTLRGPVVGTLMSNLGLEQGLLALGLSFKRAKVGDRYVMEMLREHGGTIGGETSGHILCLDKTTTGDGIVSSLQVLSAMQHERRSLAELAGAMARFPQQLLNVPVKLRGGAAASVLKLPEIEAAEHAVKQRLGDRGRVLLRASGTEPLIRVMVEGQDAGETLREAEYLAGCVRLACQ